MRNLIFCLEQFKFFHNNLMSNAPEGYIPHYFKCGRNSKAPESYIRWKSKEARLTYEQAVEWIKSGGNVGLAGMSDDPLQIIDCDNDQILTEIKSTLTTKGRSRRGGHGWYWCKGEGLPTNIPVSDVGECRGSGQYVVVPGSYIESPEVTAEYSGYYTVEKAISPTTLTYDEIPEVFREQRRKDTTQVITKPTVKPSGRYSALFDLTIENLVGSHKDGERFEHPVHGSECSKGHNFSVSRGRGHCWRCMVSLSPLQLLTVMAGKDCRSAGTGHKSAPKNGQVDDEGIFNAWLYAKKNGYIPQDDPVPLRALKHIAAKHRLDSTTNADGMLGRDTYFKTIEILERDY